MILFMIIYFVPIIIGIIIIFFKFKKRRKAKVKEYLKKFKDR